MRVFLIFFLFMASLLFAGCSVSEKPAPVAMQGMAFHSMVWGVKLTALPAGHDAVRLQAELQAILDAVNAVLSTYQADTELMHFNRAPVGEWVSVSPMLFNAVRQAQVVSAATQGRYDVTIGPLVDLWGFGPGAVPAQVPAPGDIARARAHVSWGKVSLDGGKTAMRREADVQLDLSSVGEGVAVDALSTHLEGLGVHDYMVSVAGCSRVQGKKPDGAHWVIAIEKPDGSGQPQQVLELADKVISTSGSYRNYHEIAGRRYSHTIDPATGQPITHHGVSVSVIGSADTVSTDAWATALNVLGPEQGFMLAEARGIPAYFIVHTDKGLAVRYTSAFRPYLPPTP